LRPRASYDRVSIGLHWATAGLVLAQTATGFLFYDLPFESETYQFLYRWHRSLGELAFLLILAGLLWRRIRRPVAPTPDARWRMIAAAAVKYLLTALLVAVPAVKLLRGAYGIGWEFFGLAVAARWQADAGMAALLTDLHLYGSVLLPGLALLHAGAALWHGFVARDAVLAKMGW
jgi:superoxide oxidase